MIADIGIELMRYCDQKSSPIPDYLRILERKTHLSTLSPQMMSSSSQGRLLSLLSKLKKPKCILELGTFTGYSALCLAEGLEEDGLLNTFEVVDTYDHIIEFVKKEIPLASKIIFHKQDALEGISNLDLEFDLVFIDAAKKQYPEYLALVSPLMKKGALLIADNVLWYGKVLDEKKDQETAVLDHFNTLVSESGDWDAFILPLRDGLTLAIKK
ncbi:MAG: class I SAM-dependent methyltransferase [Saprospiraceae bacterium]|uniref:Class I SAM-dependent methyltransferase n=1 Tax=Candidatus Defluviibacterium haderslevense TaxID=2981993 RepID=A0A9D7S6C6_9BACT|nr:class I SAM-dependent methyltransferase [Candidatus Defluviibacterium haderslevense]